MGKYILYGSANIVAGESKSFFSLAKSVRKTLIGIKLNLVSTQPVTKNQNLVAELRFSKVRFSKIITPLSVTAWFSQAEKNVLKKRL